MQHITNSVLFSVLLLPCLLAQGEVEPRCAAKKGGSVWLVHETTHDLTLEMQGREITTLQKTARTLHVRVTDVDSAGNLTVETTIVRVHGRMVMPQDQGEFEIDSAVEAGADDEPLVRTMRKRVVAGVGMKFVSKVSPAGEPLELGEGAAAIVDANKEGEGTLGQLTSHGLKQLVADSFGLLPDKRTASGAKWSRERVEVHGRMPTKQKLDLSLATVAPEAFEIEASGTVELAVDLIRDDKEFAGGNAEEVKRQLESTKVEKGKITRKQKTSREDGFVLQASSQIVMDLVTTESQMGEVTTHMQMDTSVVRTTAEQAVPKAPAPAGDGGKPPADKQKDGK